MSHDELGKGSSLTPSEIDKLSNKHLDIDDNLSSNTGIKVDSRAKEEMKLFSKGELEQRSANNSHRRDEFWKDLFNDGFSVVFIICVVLFVLLLLVLVLHWIFPVCWHWLSDSQLDKIEAVVIAVIVSKAVTAKQNKID